MIRRFTVRRVPDHFFSLSHTQNKIMISISFHRCKFHDQGQAIGTYMHMQVYVTIIKPMTFTFDKSRKENWEILTGLRLLHVCFGVNSYYKDNLFSAHISWNEANSEQPSHMQATLLPRDEWTRTTKYNIKRTKEECSAHLWESSLKLTPCQPCN